jgi:hypothetical protein
MFTYFMKWHRRRILVDSISDVQVISTLHILIDIRDIKFVIPAKLIDHRLLSDFHCSFQVLFYTIGISSQRIRTKNHHGSQQQQTNDDRTRKQALDVHGTKATQNLERYLCKVRIPLVFDATCRADLQNAKRYCITLSARQEKPIANSLAGSRPPRWHKIQVELVTRFGWLMSAT